MSDRRRILVCDDEPQILRALKVILRDAGFDVIGVATAREALDAAAVQQPDAAILDLVLPDGDGVEVCRSIREWSAMPIIVLSAVGEEQQKVRALEAGADDYVTKPFSPAELTARLTRALTRAGAAPAPGEPVRGRLLTHRALLAEVWGPAYEHDTQTLRVHVANLRRKIEPRPGTPRYIVTDPGVGYRFEA